MLSLQRTLSLGHLRQHPTRAGLVVLSIALGVATLVATRTLNHSLNRAARQAVNPLTDPADLLVLNAQAGVPRAMAGRLNEAGIPGLVRARPLIWARVTFPDLGPHGRSVALIGIDWAGESVSPGAAAGQPGAIAVRWRDGLSPAELLRLSLLGAPVLVSPHLAADLQRARPQGPPRFEVLGASRKYAVEVVGTVERFPHAADLLRADVVFADLGSAAALTFPDRPEVVSFLAVEVAAGADREQVRRQAQALLGDSVDVRTVEANFQSASEVTAGLELGFAIGGAGALVVGLFLVYNVLSVSVAERRHDIGILRSVGATRGQVAGVFIGEAALLGLAGSLLGLPLGAGLAWLSLGPLAQVLGELFVPMDTVSLEVPRVVLGLALAAGMVTAIVAAFVPAVRAASEQPADAVRRVPQVARPLWLFLHVGMVALLLLGGTACVVGRSHLPARAGAFGGIVCLLLGAVVATPLLTAGVGRVLQPVFRLFLGLEARLAADNLVRRPGRTGLVIAALAATGALMVQTAGFLLSSERAIHAWVEEAIAADLFVTRGASFAAATAAQPMDEALIDRVAQVPGVEKALGIRFHLLDFRDQIVFLLALDTNAFGGENDRAVARNLGHYPRLREGGTALVSENFATLYGVQVGDRIPIRGRSGPLELEVIGTVVDYTWNRGAILVDRSWYRQVFADTQVDVLDLYLRPGVDAERVRAAIGERFGKSEALYTSTRAELHRDVADQLHRVYNLAYAQQVVVGLVALLGVISALFISVLQRRRELGLLRAVGASRGQVLATVVAEAGLMGLLGALIGFATGVALEWYVVRIMLVDEAGFAFPLCIPWLGAGLVLAVTVVLAGLVGLWPAYHATRLRIPEAIAYE